MLISDDVPAPVCQLIVPPFWQTPAERCGVAAYTVDLVNGYRCASHPPRWDAAYSRQCRAEDRPGTADAYRRTMITLLGDRIVERLGVPSAGMVDRRRRPITHGTVGGYRAHYRHDVPMCEACREANRKARGHVARGHARCGTESGYKRHRARGEDCERCRRATSAVRRERRQARTGLPPGDPRHGTTNGYGNYRCRCPECMAVNSQCSREWRARRAA